MRRALVWLLPVILSIMMIDAAHAARSTGKAEFEEAVRLFRAEEYERALPLFLKAYELSGRRPATVLALAQCERALKMYDEAIKHYREYLASTPRPKDSESVLATVKLLEERKRSEPIQQPPIESREPIAPPIIESAEARVEPAPIVELSTATRAPAEVEARPAATPALLPTAIERPVSEEAEEGASVAKIIVLAAGAAAAIAGGVFAYRAASLESDVEDAVLRGVAPAAEVRANADRGFQSSNVADVLIGSAVVAIVVGLVID